MKYGLLAALVLGLSAPAVQAQRVGSYGKAIAEPAREPNLPAIGLDQRRGNQVPLDLVFRDEQDHEITLGSCVGGKPTVLILAYYRCPMLCSQVLNGVSSASTSAMKDRPRRRTKEGDSTLVTVRTYLGAWHGSTGIRCPTTKYWGYFRRGPQRMVIRRRNRMP